jgi:hypothetical protein
VSGTKRSRVRWPAVPTFHISVINDEFCSTNQHECADAESARKMALRGALDIGVEQVVGGKDYFGAEITVEHGNQRVSRFVISIGTSSLVTL